MYVDCSTLNLFSLIIFRHALKHGYERPRDRAVLPAQQQLQDKRKFGPGGSVVREDAVTKVGPEHSLARGHYIL